MLNSVIYWLTSFRLDVIPSPVCFMTSFNTYGIVTLTTDGVTSFSQLFDIKMLVKICVSV